MYNRQYLVGGWYDFAMRRKTYIENIQVWKAGKYIFVFLTRAIHQ